MKKFAALILSILVLFTVAGCRTDADVVTVLAAVERETTK